jgi:hypothetical protein
LSAPFLEFGQTLRSLRALLFQALVAEPFAILRSAFKSNYSGGWESSVGETPTDAGGTPALPRNLNSNIQDIRFIPEIRGL